MRWHYVIDEGFPYAGKVCLFLTNDGYKVGLYYGERFRYFDEIHDEYDKRHVFKYCYIDEIPDNRNEEVKHGH